MKILVTGCNGLLGQKLVELLTSKPDHYLIATAKSRLIPTLLQGEFHLLDITDRSEVNEVLSKTKPDVVINASAYNFVDQAELEPEKAFAVNKTGPENLAKATAELNIPSGVKVRIILDNQDDTPEEFDSHALNREKHVPPKSRVTLFIGPLDPGRYLFEGETSESRGNAALGVLVVQ